MFRSLRSYNYRLWAVGALVSNVGTWMQRIGQDWLVLTVLTHHNATAVGTVMALQFGPPLLLLPLSGFAADHMDRRKLLLVTQAAAGLLALGLGLLTLTGVGAAVAGVWVRPAAGLRHRIRCAGAAGVRVRPGQRRQPGQCGGAELGLLQRGAHGRPGGGRAC